VTPLTDQEIITRLTGRIDNDSYDRIKKFFPTSEKCPTCSDEGIYVLEGKDYACNCELQKLLQRHYFAANIGREYHDICLHHFEGANKDKIVPVIQDYIDNFEDNFHYGLGLSLYGPLGIGKTFGIITALKELVKQGRKVYFITFDELIAIWGAAYTDDHSKRLLQDRLMSAEVLGLDELRTDKRNKEGFLSGGLEYVLRHRTSNLLPTLITTNMTPPELEKEFGKAFSLLSGRNKEIVLTGEDHREKVKARVDSLARGHERRPIC
jgi:DNA replication protein DnaC